VAANLCREVLESIRVAHGPFTPNSVSRCQHTTGCACDVEIPGLATLELAQWAKDNFADFDQVICECYNPAKVPTPAGSISPCCRQEEEQTAGCSLSYVKNRTTGKFAYIQGLRGSVA